MHLRPKPWTKEELDRCGFFIDPPWSYAGKWQEAFPKLQPLHLELGCGKGAFISEKAYGHPENNWLGIDMIDTVLGCAQRKIRNRYEERPIDNLRLVCWDISRLERIITPEDQISAIYINFCNPWPRHKHHKKRLTHPRQLEKYIPLLAGEGTIHFKTDDDGLFEDSLTYFQSCGFKPVYLSRDLHADPWKDNVMTEHEKMFSQQGIAIKAAIFSIHK